MKRVKMNTIILSAKPTNHNSSQYVSVGEGIALVRGKPYIAWCINSFNNEDQEVIKIAIAEDNIKLGNFITYAYPHIKQVLIPVNSNSSVLNSLKTVLDTCDINLSTQIILGDTYIAQDLPTELDVILSSSEIKTSKQWCLVTKNKTDTLDKVYDKKDHINFKDKEALVGYYKFSDTKLLKSIIDNEINKGKTELSSIIAIYNDQIPIKVKTINNWFDFGHTAGLVKARTSLFNAREFNSIKVDSIKGLITKSSHKKQKLLSEVHWYTSLPKALSVYAPRIFNVLEEKDLVSIEMELYGYPNLAELFLYSYSSLEDWSNIIDVLLKVCNTFRAYTEPTDKKELISLYEIKTLERVENIEAKSPEIWKLFKGDHITINGTQYKNYFLLKNKMLERINALTEYNHRTIVHGDYSFSNILFDSTHHIVKLIDPRGGVIEPTIYGDPRYDIAKLRHCIAGLYDYVVAGFYKLEQKSDNSFYFHVTAPDFTNDLEVYFDKEIQKYGFSETDIRLIEALLFLSMIPLHSDSVNRQKAFYLTAIKKLNEILYDQDR